MNTVTTRQTTRAPRKTVAEKRAEEQAARDKRDQDFKVGFANAYSARHSDATFAPTETVLDGFKIVYSLS